MDSSNPDSTVQDLLEGEPSSEGEDADNLSNSSPEPRYTAMLRPVTITTTASIEPSNLSAEEPSEELSEEKEKEREEEISSEGEDADNISNSSSERRSSALLRQMTIDLASEDWQTDFSLTRSGTASVRSLSEASAHEAEADAEAPVGELTASASSVASLNTEIHNAPDNPNQVTTSGNNINTDSPPRSPQPPPPSLTEFTLFSALPTEMRLKMWDFIMEPRVIEVIWRDPRTGDDGWYILSSCRPIPMLVCKESHKYAETIYLRFDVCFKFDGPSSQCHSRHMHCTKAKVNYNIDLIYFNPAFGVPLSSIRLASEITDRLFSYACWFPDPFGRMVQHLAFEYATFRPGLYLNPSIEWPFKNLKSINLVVGDVCVNQDNPAFVCSESPEPPHHPAIGFTEKHYSSLTYQRWSRTWPRQGIFGRRVEIDGEPGSDMTWQQYCQSRWMMIYGLLPQSTIRPNIQSSLSFRCIDIIRGNSDGTPIVIAAAVQGPQVPAAANTSSNPS